MDTDSQPNLQGLTVVSFESRRAQEIGELIRRYGGQAIIAPSMREIPLSQNSAAVDFVRRLEAGEIDIVIFLTGVGTRTLIEAVASEYPRERLASALKRVVRVARGPKPVAALKELGLQPTISVPEPNTWRELLAELDGKTEIRGKRVAVQEYGITNQQLIAGLEERGAKVVRVPVYRWALPDDLEPLTEAIQKILNGKIEVAIFTTAVQIEHVFQVYDQMRIGAGLVQAFHKIVVASVGPDCSEALRRRGLVVDIEPQSPKMGPLVVETAEKAQELSRAKHFS